MSILDIFLQIYYTKSPCRIQGILVRKSTLLLTRKKLGVRMDIKKNKTRGFFALSVLIILCLSVASIMSFYSPKDNANAFIANNIPSQSTNLGEMLLEGYEEDTTGKGNVFDKEIFWELVSQVTGVENPNRSEEHTSELQSPWLI